VFRCSEQLSRRPFARSWRPAQTSVAARGADCRHRGSESDSAVRSGPGRPPTPGGGSRGPWKCQPAGERTEAHLYRAYRGQRAIEETNDAETIPDRSASPAPPRGQATPTTAAPRQRRSPSVPNGTTHRTTTPPRTEGHRQTRHPSARNTSVGPATNAACPTALDPALPAHQTQCDAPAHAAP
jgi:hypothetical protein